MASLQWECDVTALQSNVTAWRRDAYECAATKPNPATRRRNNNRSGVAPGVHGRAARLGLVTSSVAGPVTSSGLCASGSWRVARRRCRGELPDLAVCRVTVSNADLVPITASHAAILLLTGIFEGRKVLYYLTCLRLWIISALCGCRSSVVSSRVLFTFNVSVD